MGRTEEPRKLEEPTAEDRPSMAEEGSEPGSSAVPAICMPWRIAKIGDRLPHDPSAPVGVPPAWPRRILAIASRCCSDAVPPSRLGCSLRYMGCSVLVRSEEHTSE